MTELSFLLELLLNHKLPKATKELVTERIKEVEAKLGSAPTPVQRAPIRAASGQSPSTQKILEEMAAEAEAPVTQTPAVAQAMAHRAALIAQATSGVEEKGRTSPRKF